MEKTLLIPNKKINYSPQFRNYLPGKQVKFKEVDKRVEEICVELDMVDDPVITVNEGFITASCETTGSTIFYYKKTTESNVLVYTEPFESEEGVSYCFFATKSGMLNSNFVDVDLN